VLAAGGKSPYLGPELFQCPGPMADCVFNTRTQLAEGSMVFWDEKQGIVAEATAAARLTHNQSVTASFNHGLYFTRRAGQCRRTNVIRLPLILRQSCQLGKETSIIGGIVPVLARIPS
jgi:hypothetical protein